MSINTKKEKIEKLSKRIRENPEDSFLYESRALCYCGIEEYEKALGDYSLAIQLSDQLRKSKLYYERGDSCILLKKFKEAIKDFTCSIEFGSDEDHIMNVYNMRGLAYRRIGKREESKKDFTSAIEATETSDTTVLAVYYFNRSTVCEKLEDSLFDLNRAIELYDENEGDVLSCQKEKLRLLRKEEKDNSLFFLEEASKKEYMKVIDYILEHSVVSSKSKKRKFLEKKLELSFSIIQRRKRKKKKNKEEERKIFLEYYTEFIKCANELLKKHYNRIVDLKSLYVRRIILNKKLEKWGDVFRDLGRVIDGMKDESKGFESKSFYRYKTLLDLYERRIETAQKMGDDNLIVDECGKLFKCLLERGEDEKFYRIGQKYRLLRVDIFLKQEKEKEAFDDATYYFDLMKNKELRSNKNGVRKSFYQFGISLYEKENNSEEIMKICKKVFTKLIERDSHSSPRKREYYEYRGDCWYFLGNNSEAVKDFEVVLELDPDSVFSMDRLVFSYIELKRWTDAIRIGLECIQKLEQEDGMEILDLSEEELEEEKESICSALAQSFTNLGKEIKRYYFRNYIKPGSFDTNGVYQTYTSKKNDRFSRLEGGHKKIRRNRKLWKMGSVCCKYVLAHIAGYEMKNRKKMFEWIVAGLLEIRSLKKPGMLDEMKGLFLGMMEKEFGSVGEQEMEDRLDFVIKENLVGSTQNDDSLTLRWSNGLSYDIKQYLFLSPKVFEENVIEFGKNILPVVEYKLMLKFLFGMKTTETEIVSNIVPLYDLFSKLKMEHHIFALCELVKKFSLKDSLRIFCRTVTIFESADNISESVQSSPKEGKIDVSPILNKFDMLIDEDEEEEEEEEEENGEEGKWKTLIDMFKSPLSLSLFLKLQTHLVQIERFHNYVLALDSIGFYVKLKHTKIVPESSHDKVILSHPFFTGIDPNLKTFKSIFEEKILKVLYSLHGLNPLSLSHDNIELFADGYKMDAAKEILILRSNFFYRMFSFPGRESQSRSVVIEDLDEEGLKRIVERIYTNKMSSIEEKSYRTMFKLLIHSEMYEDKILQADVLLELDRDMEKEWNDNNFVLKLLEIGHFFQDLPNWIRYFMVNHWCSLMKMKKNDINAVITHSIKTNEMAKNIKGMKIQIKNLNVSLKRKRKSEDGELPKKKKKKKKK